MDFKDVTKKRGDDHVDDDDNDHDDDDTAPEPHPRANIVREPSPSEESEPSFHST